MLNRIWNVIKVFQVSVQFKYISILYTNNDKNAILKTKNNHKNIFLTEVFESFNQIACRAILQNKIIAISSINISNI